MALKLVIVDPTFRPERPRGQRHRGPGLLIPGFEELHFSEAKRDLPLLGITGEITRSWSRIAPLMKTADLSELHSRHFHEVMNSLLPEAEDEAADYYARMTQTPPDKPVAEMVCAVLGRPLSMLDWWALEVEALRLAVFWLCPGGVRGIKRSPSEQFARYSEQSDAEDLEELMGRWSEFITSWADSPSGPVDVRPCLTVSQADPNATFDLAVASLSEYFLRLRCRDLSLEPTVWTGPSGKKQLHYLCHSDQLMPLAWAEIWSAIRTNIYAKFCRCGRVFAIGRQPRKETCSAECARALKRERFKYNGQIGEEAYRNYMRDKQRESRQRVKEG